MSGIAVGIMHEFRKHIRSESREIVTKVHRLITDRTPIDTGHAASNWVASSGAPSDEIYGSKDDVDVDGAEADTEFAIQRWDPFQSPLYIANNVPYISALNDGYSPQAPPGYVEDAVDEVQRDYESRT